MYSRLAFDAVLAAYCFIWGFAAGVWWFRPKTGAREASQ